MMARIPDDTEAQRELVEGNLACIGNAIVLVELVTERVARAEQISRQASLLGPARSDLGRIKALLCLVQSRLAVPVRRKQQDKTS